MNSDDPQRVITFNRAGSPFRNPDEGDRKVSFGGDGGLTSFGNLPNHNVNFNNNFRFSSQRHHDDLPSPYLGKQQFEEALTKELMENEGTIEEVKEKSQESSPQNSCGLADPAKGKKNQQVKFGDPSHTKSSNTLSGTSEVSSIFSNNNARGNEQRQEFERRKSMAVPPPENVSRMYTHDLDEIGKGTTNQKPLPKIPEGPGDVSEIIKEKEKETKRQSE